MYPVMLDVRDRFCLVVGGGGIALRKVQGLLNEQARVTVIASEPHEALVSMADAGKLRLIARKYQVGDVAGYALAFAATNDRQTNERVFSDAEAAGIWVNVADVPDLCTFHLPARVRRGSLQLAIASDGKAPFAVSRIRQLLERRFGPEWAEWIDSAWRFREKARNANLSFGEANICFDRFFESTVDDLSLAVRVASPSEEASWLKSDRPVLETPDQDEDSEDQGTATFERGMVSLVGAGPGDPGLLTIRGLKRLLAADAIVYDRLAETVVPCDIESRVELHPVGKKPGHHPVPQAEINALLVRLAREGKRVVRLKGGDPYVFGRGGEEAEALAAAGIRFEVVPCVTAAVAVPAYAGIPVTHRDEVVRVSLITAHESIKGSGPQVRWDLLGRDEHSTLIGYMGVTSLVQVVERLIGSGMSPETPAAMIERGTTARQRTVHGSLVRLPELVEKNGIKPPALFVFGPCVNYANRLEWFEGLPLFGERLLLACSLGEHFEPLDLAGAEVVEFKMPVTEACRVVMNALPLSGCIVKTRDEIDALDDERYGGGWNTEMVAWCMTNEAEEQALKQGWRNVKRIPPGASSEVLIQQIQRLRKDPATEIQALKE